jgi:hypothetical protein
MVAVMSTSPRQMHMTPMAGRMTLVAGTDCQRPHESIPVRHKMIPGITSVTTPGSRMIARRCLHISIVRLGSVARVVV